MRWWVLGFTALVLAACGEVSQIPGTSPWREVSSGTSDSLTGVAYGNGVFVAVGGASGKSTILVSRDGQSWTRVSYDAQSFLNGIAYDNGLFVAVGFDETILTSPDGYSWTKVHGTGSALQYLNRVAYGGGRWVATGAFSQLLVSQDAGASAWQRVDLNARELVGVVRERPLRGFGTARPPLHLHRWGDLAGGLLGDGRRSRRCGLWWGALPGLCPL